MADHIPRLCQECRCPLSAAEKRIDCTRCTWHRETFWMSQWSEQLEEYVEAGGLWADGPTVTFGLEDIPDEVWLDES